MRSKILVTVLSLMFSCLVYAQDDNYSQCYRTHRNKGIAAYKEGKYEEAKERFAGIRKGLCVSSDIPANNDLDDWIAKCNKAIGAAEEKERQRQERERQAREQREREAAAEKERQRQERERQAREQREREAAANITLSVSPSTLSFEASGGTATVTVSTNAASWTTSANPSWCSVSESGNTITVTCRRHTASGERTGYFYVNAGKKQVTVNLRQEADPYETGEKYYSEKNYIEAVKWYRKSAEQGNASAQNNLGWMYRNGYGVTKDYEEAVKWYRKSAEQGNATAQYNLGIMYRNGYGVTKDYEEAVKWYRKSAEQGYANAQYNLGYMYRHGYGVTKDTEEAVKWYHKAAAQGDQDAKDALKRLGYE